MKLTHSTKMDVAYLCFKKIADGEVVKTIPTDGENIHLDFNEQHQLVGIEFLNASRNLPKELLDTANIGGQ